MRSSRSESVKDILDRMGVDPLRVMASIAAGTLICGVCRGKGRTKVQPPHNGKYTVRTCEKCHGSGHEPISHQLQAKAAKELAQYISPAALVRPATERMQELLKSRSDAVAIKAAKAILDQAQMPLADEGMAEFLI